MAIRPAGKFGHAHEPGLLVKGGRLEVVALHPDVAHAAPPRLVDKGSEQGARMASPAERSIAGRKGASAASANRMMICALPFPVARKQGDAASDRSDPPLRWRRPNGAAIAGYRHIGKLRPGGTQLGGAVTFNLGASAVRR